ncbi:EAL domain-containing protein [Arsenicitalea aurantiaca]|uniref:EAL domain-containing protein n=1 Tax=Arsenicitalea aurantiaca TaxID=1783274 RepID=A0A433XBN9_9HYPH|nr:EAL domain-containing protein [Arsenicitalea aurantiaca]RUT31430.1 EAL domain-containing protein [Arsenicitalea aurantiaca]
MNDNNLFETLTKAVPGIVWISNSRGSVDFNNEHWQKFTGMTLEAGLGHGWLNAIHPADVAAFHAQLPLDGARQPEIQTEIRVRRHDGVYHRHLLSARYVGGDRWIGCAIDAHEWLISEARDAAHNRILDLVLFGAELEEVLVELCRAAEKQLSGATCSILLVHQDGENFSTGIAPKFPKDTYRDIASVRIDARAGSCGTAVYEKRDVISSDISTDPLWEGWREPMLALGYSACWSKPVFDSKGRVIASFGFYFPAPREPSSAETREMDRLRRLAAVTIERARMLEALRESEEHYRYTVELNPQIPWTADAQGKVLTVSGRWTEATGITHEDALGDGWLTGLHPDDVEPTTVKWQQSIVSGCPLDASYRIRLKDGSYRWVRARAFARANEDGRVLRWYGAVDDIHERQVAEERLRRQAFQDDLTGLPNRRQFVNDLRAALASSSEPLGLMVLDMDDFKLINDRHGHLTGDAVLRLFGRHLLSITEPGEHVFRLGGDEFAIISRVIFSDECLLTRAREIEALLEARMKRNKKARTSRASIGCALGGPDEFADEVFKRADLALYAAKSTAKGSIKLFDPKIRSLTARRSEEFELARTALREGWIEPFFQPIVSLSTFAPRGWEALLRIRHPEKGLLSPIAVRSALDDPRLSDAIGLRMVELVVDQMARWSAAHVPFGQCSINLATENIVSRDFGDRLITLLDHHKLERRCVKLEITERVLLDELEDVICQRLDDLRMQGVSISLDDFGTGYASLVHLQTLPVDEMKIDRSFISGMRSGPKGREIVRAMIGLAKTMGLATVAEGVETPAEAALLASWGCEFGQGYLFGRPMNADEVPAHLAEARWRRANV